MKMRVEKGISNLLRGGVILSAAIILAGGAPYLIHYASSPIGYEIFQRAAPELRSIAGVIKAAAHRDAKAIMQLGILLLIATPVARVIFTLFVFIRQRDHAYVAVTLIVLAVLSYSLFGPVLR